jgi:hypothetical protein
MDGCFTGNVLRHRVPGVLNEFNLHQRRVTTPSIRRARASCSPKDGGHTTCVLMSMSSRRIRPSAAATCRDLFSSPKPCCASSSRQSRAPDHSRRACELTPSITSSRVELLNSTHGSAHSLPTRESGSWCIPLPHTLEVLFEPVMCIRFVGLQAQLDGCSSNSARIFRTMTCIGSLSGSWVIETSRTPFLASFHTSSSKWSQKQPLNE